ncbi:histone deacetylase 8 isoform X2 [Anabrus simplex]
MTVLPSRPASLQEINAFHSLPYIEHLQKINDCTDLEELEDESEEFGLGYDCPLLERLYNYVELIAGASISAAEALVDGSATIAINWCGGWHHAQRDEAEGFCYVNDIVLGIHKLHEAFKRVLYIDLDVHHGDGVENAFACSPSVLTLSFHKHEPGFYPGTGGLNDVGFGKGRYYSINVPLEDGIRDDLYCYIFDSVVLKVWAAYRPQAVVVQCGADGLNEDPMGTFNLTPVGLGRCVKRILSWEVPTLFLGGGGYNLPNVARCWTYLTAVILGRDIPSSIPEHENLLQYGADFELDIEPGYRRDNNSKKSLEAIIQTISDHLDHII